MGLQWNMHSALAGICLWLLFSLFFNPVRIVSSDVPHTADERKRLNMEGDVIGKEDDLRDTQHGVRFGEVECVDSSLTQCVKLERSELLALHSDGDVVIGGFFPLHYVVSKPQHSYNSKPQRTSCSGFHERSFRWMMTMVFAVEEINHNSNLLPGVKLGYRIVDSCNHIHNSLQALFWLLSQSDTSECVVEKTAKNEASDVEIEAFKTLGITTKSKRITTFKKRSSEVRSVNTKIHKDLVYYIRDNTTEEIKKRQSSSCLYYSPVPAVVGLASSSPTRAVAETLGPFKIPLVSYFATCTCLTDKNLYPSFLRTVPNDLFQVQGLVQLVTYFGWFWVGTVGATDDYSLYGIQAFSTQFAQQGGCVAFHLTMPTSPTVAQIQVMADTLQSSAARVVVVIAAEVDLLDLFSELAHRNVTGIQWIASEAWVTSSRLASPQFHTLLGGTLGFSIPGVNIPGLKEFLLNVRPSPKPGMEFINMFWEEHFGCKLEFERDRAKEYETATLDNFKHVIHATHHKPGSINNSDYMVGLIIGQKKSFNHLADKTYEDTVEKPVCTGSEDLKYTNSSYSDVSQVRISYNVYKAVYAIAHALHTFLKCDSAGPNTGLCEKHSSFATGQFLQHLKMVNFTNQFDEKVYFDPNGEPVPRYDIINWQKDSKDEMRFIKVGSYDGSALHGQQLQIMKNTIVWTKGGTQVPVSQCSAPCPPGSRQATRKGEPKCCFDCLPCADGEISNQTGSTECTKCPEYYWSDKEKVKCVTGVEEFLSFYDTMGIILVALTLLGFILTTIITIVFHSFRYTPIVKANNSEISFLLLLSLKLCFLCSLVFIGQPSWWTCRLRQAAFGISFVLCLSCLLVKTIVVLLAFRTNIPGSGSRKLFGASQQRILIICTMFPQIFLCSGWVLGAPPFPFRNPNYKASTGKIVVECKEPWPPGFYLLLGYTGLLAFVCLLLAFLGRKLPDTFNEAKLITFSMLVFWAVWISFIPAYVSSPGKFSVAVEIFAILASSFGLLLCIFVPKCYIILLHPERNVKKGMTGKYSR